MASDWNWKNNRDMRDAAERLQELGEQADENLEEAAEEISLRIMADARRNVNVDTGRLRASINQEVERVTEHTVRAIVGSNVEYAPYLEVTHPYLRPAIQDNADWIRQRIEEALDAAAAEVS